MFDPTLVPFAGLLDLLQLVHRQELAELAVRADEIAARAANGGPRTDTPGTDAFKAMHPELVHDFRTQPSTPTPRTEPAITSLITNHEVTTTVNRSAP